MARIVFYANDTRSNIEQLEYYRQDVDALRTLGHEVVVCTRYSEIPIRFDALFVWWWTYALWPVLLCRALGRPCIITGTFNFRFPEHFKSRDYFGRPLWQRALIAGAAKSCSLNLFVNSHELDQCSRHFKLQNGRYFPHCLPPDYLLGPSTTRRKVLLNVAWSGKQNLVRKGIPELLGAVRRLNDMGERVELYLAGVRGDGVDDLLEMITQLGISQNVHYLGELSRVEKIRMLREIEVYVQPSRYEGFGVAILEAMGCGACVIVCDVGAVREVVGDCGVYVPPSSVEDLATAIRTSLDDDAGRRAIQARAVQRANALYAFGLKVDRLRAVLHEVGVASVGGQ